MVGPLAMEAQRIQRSIVRETHVCQAQVSSGKIRLHEENIALFGELPSWEASLMRHKSTHGMLSPPPT